MSHRRGLIRSALCAALLAILVATMLATGTLRLGGHQANVVRLEELPIEFPANPEGQLTLLTASEDFRSIVTPESTIASAIVHYRDDWFVITHYRSLRLINMQTGEQRALEPQNLEGCQAVGDAAELPRPEDAWNPTGLYYDEPRDRLYVANYHAKNVLVGQIQEDNTFYAERIIGSADMVAPEGVAVNEAGDRIAVTDCDGNGLYLFDGDGKVLWRREVLMPHGLELSQDAVYCASLADRQILKLDYSGNEQRRVGRSLNKGPDGYMWPVGLELYENILFVVDAHIGRIVVLDGNLNYATALGCNGPYWQNFNYPYAICAWDDRFYVTDTFAERILALDLKGNIVAQLSQAPPEMPKAGEAVYVPEYPLDIAYIYEEIKDIPVTFLWESKSRLYAGYSSLWTARKDGKKRYQTSMLIYFTGVDWFDTLMSSELYKIFAIRATTESHTYYVFSSPQSDAFIFYCVDARFGGIVWFKRGVVRDVVRGHIVGDEDFYVQYLKDFDRLTDGFLQAVAGGQTRYEAYCDTFVGYFEEKPSGAVAAEDFRAMLESQCSTGKIAKQLYKKCVEGQPDESDFMPYYNDREKTPLQHHTVLENILLRSFCGAAIGTESE